MLKDVVFRGWPNLRKQCPRELWDYWNFRCDLVIDDGLVLKGDRIIIPQSLKKKVLEAIHIGHQGETKCLLLARNPFFFWPGIPNDVRIYGTWCKSVKHVQDINQHLPSYRSCSLICQQDHGRRLELTYLSTTTRNI